MSSNSLSPKSLVQLNDERRKRIQDKIKHQQELAVTVASCPVSSVAWKADRRMTAYPLFAPDKRNRHDVFEYISPDGRCRIKVFPHPELGRAKVWDADVFTYFLSRAYAAYQRTHQIPHKIETSAYQVLKNLNKDPRSGKNNQWLREAIRRLNGTSYQATLFNGTREAETGFHLLDYRLYNLDGSNAKNNDTVGKIIIYFNPDMIAGWLSDIASILSLPNGVIDECIREQRSGLRKRLLLLIGTRLGHQESITLSLENFKGLCGYTRENKFFKAALKGIIPTLPWALEFSKLASGNGEKVVIAPKQDAP